jgi:hypothetical protein
MKISRKTISLIELAVMIVSIFSFAYLVSTNVPEILMHPQESKILEFFTKPLIPLVSAEPSSPSGCCLETTSGSICQDMGLADSSACKKNLIGTSCNTVSECQIGCCYDQNLGSCSMNSPKQKCESNGGNWSSDSKCNIAECQLGCCVLGDSVSMTTNRECTLLSRLYNFDKIFQNLDAFGSCLAYTDLADEGACLTPAGDFSGKNDCTFTAKSNCAGEFKKGYLCTSEELNTNCEKTDKTSCIEGKDQIYFLDSCENRANIYDASRVTSQPYWEKIISKENSCASQSESCGNCDYLTGSICHSYDKNKDVKPRYGNNVCRNLNCGERKHGESWCIYDVDPNEGIYPIGAGSFVATCVENQISVSSCGSFNQFICAENRDESYGFSEAKCLANDWRSCMNANDADSYAKVKEKCDENPQCIMFNDLYGEDKLKRADGQFFAGFNPGKTNAEQGAIDDLGKDQNKLISHCVPRFTPGLQFWTSNPNPLVSNGQTESTASYGGNLAETSALCSLANFVCVSQINRACRLAGGCGIWEDDDRNWECNSDGSHVSIKGKDLPALLSAMNERCRSIGSCGVSSNLVGKINSNEVDSFSVNRIKIDKNGKTQDKYDTSAYNLSGEYLSSISRSFTPISTLDEVASLGTGLSAESLNSADTTGNPSPSSTPISLASLVSADSNTFQDIINLAGPLTLTGFLIGWKELTSAVTQVTYSGWREFWKFLLTPTPEGSTITSGGTVLNPTRTVTTPNSNVVIGLKSAGITIGCAIIGSYLGAKLGGLIAKKHDWSPGRQQAFIQFMGAVGSALGSVIGSGIVSATLVTGGSFGTGVAATVGLGSSGIISAGLSFGTVLPVVGLLVAIALIIYEAFFNKFEEQEYFILQYSCGAWEPPKNGDCSVCNNDVRPCSEYRCKSLGSNCHYFNSNGEPGFCSSMADIWKASIKPWPEIISPEHKYASISHNDFKIEGKDDIKVLAWTPVTFGIITDKPAICKVGLNHSSSFDQLGTTMLSSIDTNTGRVDGLHHQITLSPSVTTKDYVTRLSSLTTLPIEEGENDYFIKCRNFAGQENDAPFIVRVVMASGPDLTPPSIVSYSPEEDSYLKFGETEFSFSAYLNEPAECKYALTYDYNSYAEMPNQMECITSPSAGFYGLWICHANLQNLTESANQVFIKCLDQPGLEETDLITRIETPRSFVYNIKKCTIPLSVAITNPFEGKNFDGKEPASFDLTAVTSGCINGGEAVCSFSVDGNGKSIVPFLKTGKTLTHSQPISGIDNGNHSIFVSCEDEAGNIANTSMKFTVTYDNTAPIITRAYIDGSDLVIKTNELAECVFKYHQKPEENCNFGFENAKNMTSFVQTLADAKQGYYYIRCRDAKLNEPLGCTGVIVVQ